MSGVLGSMPVGPPAEAMEVSTLEAVPAEPERLVADGRYRVQHFLGQGANKQVFLAEDTWLGRDVAIAFIRRAAASQATLVRVRREVQAMARLGDHPNIVTVYDVGDDGGRTFIVSQYVAGGSLSGHLARLPGGRMPLPDALAVAQQVSEALTHAHDHPSMPTIHRDLKPDNVFLMPGHGLLTALLGDFGMAIAGNDIRITSEHAFVGTAPYMAPEQARGHPVDVRSDIYSLGVMLFELLCGQLPFSGESVSAIVAQAAMSPRPSVAALDAAIPAELDLLVKRLMAVRPADRPWSAAEVRDRLAALSPITRSTPAARPAVEPVRLPPALATSRQWSFVGRAKDLVTLRDNWRQAGAGQPRAVFVCGNAGIGKTRMCSEFAQEVHALGATVLYGRCEEEALAPYGPFIHAIRHYATHRPSLVDVLDLPAGFELARLGWPISGGDRRLRASTGEGDRDTERYQLFEAAVALVKAMARSAPLLVIFDDLQWADLPTLRLLRHLIRFVDEGAVMLVCTMRDDEPKPDERREHALGELQREAVVETMRLEGLNQDETAALVEKWAHAEVEPDVIACLRDRTGGNPFYIEESLRPLRNLARLRDDLAESRPVSHSVPKAIEALILRRLSSRALSPATLEVLDAAAIIGREFGLGLLAALLRRPVPDITDALEEAIRKGLVIEVPGYVDRLAFCHAFVRETLLSRQQPSHRMRLHARCGEALEARYATSGPHAAELAHHFFEARHDERDEKALRYALAAARWASGALAYEDAVTQQDRALQILAEQGRERDPERCDLLLSRGRALWRAGETEAARDSFAQAAGVARQLEDAERFARAALGFGHRYYDPDEVDEQLIALLEEALERLGERDSGWRARILAGLADALHFRESPDTVQELGREAVRMARSIDDKPALVVAYAGLHAALLHIDFLEERLEVNKEMLDLIERIGDRGPQEATAHALHWRLYNLFEVGDMETARREHATLSELAERLRQPIYLHFAAAWEAKWAETEGRFDEAEHLALRSLELAERSHMPYAKSNYAGQLFGLRRDQGLLEKLPGEIREFIGERPQLVVWRAGMLLARLDAGEQDRARAEFEDLARLDFARVPRDIFWLGAMCLLAEACARFADRERATVLFDKLERHADRNAQIGLALSVGVVHRFLGGLAGVMERWAEAVDHFEEARRLSKNMGAITSLAHIECEYAETLLARGDAADRASAAKHLAEARRIAGAFKVVGREVHPVASRAAALERDV
jgi:hypothetical protein